MLQLAIYEPEGGPRYEVATKFPFTIGRAAGSDLRLESPGVWENHAVISFDSTERRFVIRSEGAGVLLINREKSDQRNLMAGDEINVGAARIVVSLSPASQPALRSKEGVFWGILLFVTVSELALAVLLR